MTIPFLAFGSIRLQSAMSLLLHTPDNTGLSSHGPWNEREIGVRRRLEVGFPVMEADRC